MWSPLDSSFLNEKATTTTTRPIVSVVLSLINDKKVACASQVSHVLIDSEGIIKIPIIITKECVNPEIHLSLIDKAQKVLDTQTFLITTHNKPTEQSSPIKYGTNYGIIALLSGLLVLVIIFFLKKRNKVLLTTPVITLFILVSFLGGIRNAHADSIVLFYYCTGPCPAAAAIYIDEGLDKASYAPGDTVNVNYYVSSDDNPQPTNNICPNLRAVINGLGASVGPDADPNCHTAQDLRVGYSVSASAGGVVPSGSSGTVSTSLGSNGYSNKTGQPLPFTIATPLCSWSQTSNDLSQKCNLPFTYLPSPLPSCSMSNVNTRYSGCQGTTQSEAICECVGVPPPPTVEIHFSFLDKLKLFISDIFTVLKTNSLVEYAFASVMNTKN